MPIDFNADYIMHTDKGNFLIPVFKFDGVLASYIYLDAAHLYYKGALFSDLLANDFECSTAMTAVYRYSYLGPFMGRINITKTDGTLIPNTYFNVTQSGTSAVSDFVYNGQSKTGRSGTMGNASNDNHFLTYVLVIDNNGNAYICDLRPYSGYIYPSAADASYTVNTIDKFGFASIMNVDFSKLRGLFGIITPDSWITDFENSPIAESLEIFRESTDPYAPGGTSETGGGTGTFDLSSDSIDFPSLPTLTAVSTGLVSIYTPTLTQLNSLANFLWNANPTDVDWWKKLVANPLDLILGLSIVPVSVPAGASQNIKVGLIDTGVAMTKAATQFVTVDCGSINVAEVWGSALDYSPFTKFSIYLPFIGTRTINTDDIMGKTVHVKYNIDLLSGACTAMIKCGDSVLYQYSGACAISLPLSGETFTSMITSTIQLAASIAATVSSGGAAAGITAASAANSVMSMKPQIERAGGVSGAAGQLGIMTPYLIAEVPRQSVPARYNTFAGYPSNINAVLGDLTGYTEIETIYIKGIAATKSELDEIETLLKAGVII